MKPIGSTGPWNAGQVTARARAILAGNPGWMTLDGTNSWLLLEPGSPECVLVDPGPDDPVHRKALLSAAAAADARIALIILTHAHPDHSEGARALHDATGAPVLALDPAFRLGSEGLTGGDSLSVGGLDVTVLRTPGHTLDSLSLVLPADRALLTGDTILGRGTAVIAHPDGHLGSYLDSLQTLGRTTADLDAQWILPGHGPALGDPAQVIAEYLTHREQRLALVIEARNGGASDPDDLLDMAYPGLDQALRPAAMMSLLAQLEYLDEAHRDGPPPSGAH